ncbi:MAG: divalent-cation tolerance protein CutA [Beijerinckiaceae bacterium]|nr:divalent-cation tolerance protein CutA [Beijerinckiaceae bacterium]
MGAYSIVMTTVDSQEAADAVIARVLDEKLAACVQESPVTSHYVWQGERQRDAEILLQMKIKTSDWDALCATISDVHPYDTPEIVCVAIDAGDARYLAWIADVTR